MAPSLRVLAVPTLTTWSSTTEMERRVGIGANASTCVAASVEAGAVTLGCCSKMSL
jgi:hypothetical protein